MLRNRELRWVALIGLVLAGVFTCAGFLHDRYSGWLVMGVAVSLLLLYALYTHWRYREIARLTDYVQRLVAKEATLDVRDNREGELSMLKNQLYKMTQMMSEQGEYLKRDRVRMSDALSDISHQLKTPLTSLRVMSDLLGQADLPPDKRESFTQQISFQLDRMEWLMAALLKLAKLDAGTAVFRKEPVQLSQLVQTSLQPLLIPIELQELELLIDGDPEAQFVGDLNWTAEALLNVLKNAVEHTPRGGKLFIRYAENTLYSSVEVIDSGPGIAREELGRIFRRFYRGSGASQGSSGIGLALAQRIAVSQNGTLEVEIPSQAEQGACFVFKFFK